VNREGNEMKVLWPILSNRIKGLKEAVLHSILKRREI
jgi:hypothetical protein